MALNWNWDKKCGEAIIEQQITSAGETKEFTRSLYEGNAFLIFLNEWKEENKDMYSLYTFFADEAHAKICLGLIKNRDGVITKNIFEDGFDKLVKLRINKAKCGNWKKIVTLFSQAFDEIIIELYKEETK